MSKEIFQKSRQLAKDALKDTESSINSDILEVALASFLRDTTVLALDNNDDRCKWMDEVVKYLDKDPPWIHKMLRPGKYGPRHRN